MDGGVNWIEIVFAVITCAAVVSSFIAGWVLGKGADMQMPVTKPYLDELRSKLIDAEEQSDIEAADRFRSEYRQACAAAYSDGDLVFRQEK